MLREEGSTHEIQVREWEYKKKSPLVLGNPERDAARLDEGDH